MTFGSSRLECDKSLLDGWIKLCEGLATKKLCINMNLGYDAEKWWPIVMIVLKKTRTVSKKWLSEM
jgi:hypothetical protein